MSSSIPEKQQAIVFDRYGGPIEDLTFATIDTPKITLPKDILVRVKAIALNPVDLKLQAGMGAAGTSDGSRLPNPIIPGFDAAGVVVAVGGEVSNFKVGDEVYYSGLLTRAGSYQQYQLVDYRIVALKPRSLSFEDAAALPLTSITAWEGMVEEMRISNVEASAPGSVNKRILIHGGAGGVGSMAIQLAKLWGLTVIATASRPETIKWCKELGADEVVDHRASLVEQFKNRNLAPVDYVYLTFGEQAAGELAEIMNPFGVIVGINGDIGAEQVSSSFRNFFFKRISFHYEMMFARPMYDIEPERQGALLTEVAKLVDAGKVRSTVYTKLNWHQIHEGQHIVSDRAPIGKIVLAVD